MNNIILYLLKRSGKPNLFSNLLHSSTCLHSSFAVTNQQKEGIEELVSAES